MSLRITFSTSCRSVCAFAPSESLLTAMEMYILIMSKKLVLNQEAASRSSLIMPRDHRWFAPLLYSTPPYRCITWRKESSKKSKIATSNIIVMLMLKILSNNKKGERVPPVRVAGMFSWTFSRKQATSNHFGAKKNKKNESLSREISQHNSYYTHLLFSICQQKKKQLFSKLNFSQV